MRDTRTKQCPDCQVTIPPGEHCGKYYRFCKRCGAFRRRLAKYGITPEEFNALGTECGICGKDLTDIKLRFVDHEHETGRVRGLLCNQCNVGVGMFRDSPELLEAAIKYLREGSEWHT